MDHLSSSHSVLSATDWPFHPPLTASDFYLLSQPIFLSVKGFHQMQEPLLCFSSPPWAQVLSYFLSSSFPLLSFILPGYAGIFIVLSSVQGLLLVFSWCFSRTVPSVDVFLMHLNWTFWDAQAHFLLPLHTSHFTKQFPPFKERRRQGQLQRWRRWRPLQLGWGKRREWLASALNHSQRKQHTLFQHLNMSFHFLNVLRLSEKYFADDRINFCDQLLLSFCYHDYLFAFNFQQLIMMCVCVCVCVCL